MNENRKKIIDATLELVKERGFSNFTVLDICRKAYIARSTFYYQFHSIDEVFAQCFNNDYVIKQADLSVIHSFSSPLDKLFFYHISYLKAIQSLGINHARYQQLERIKGSTSSNRKINYLITSYSIVPYIREAQNANLLLNTTAPEILSYTITKCMAGCINQWVTDNGDYDLIKDTLDTLRTIYLIPDDYSWKDLLNFHG